MTPDRAALMSEIKDVLLSDLERHGPHVARDVYDWLAARLNEHDAASGNVHYLNAREMIEKVKP